MINRRQFNKGILALALGGLATHLNATEKRLLNTLMGDGAAYGKLIKDPKGILDLPKGFSYTQLSSLNDVMHDGQKVPDRADGMGCIALDDERVALVRNHEIAPTKALLEISEAPSAEQSSIAKKAYDTSANGYPLPGGTSHIIYNTKTGKVETQFMSLVGTIRNCSGGTTPWGSWLTCEETVVTASEFIGKNHGYVFEVPATATGLIDPKPLKEMGRFNHEATCVDPRTGIVYLTEDRDDSLFYHFIPNTKNKLSDGGQLQALVIKDNPQFDTRNWASVSMQLNEPLVCQWIDLQNVDSEQDDLRLRGHAQGAAVFARGEGIHFENGEMYFCCTSGGAQKLGQIMRYQPSINDVSPDAYQQTGTLSLFVESANKASFNFGDNITVAPNNHLIVCEDQYSDTVNNKLKGVTPDGRLYDFARVRWQTEPAGVCFSPDGSVMFVNLYSPTATLAITGPWDKFANN